MLHGEPGPFINNKRSSNGREIKPALPGLWNAKPQPFPLRLGFLLSVFFSPVILCILPRLSKLLSELFFVRLSICFIRLTFLRRRGHGHWYLSVNSFTYIPALAYIKCNEGSRQRGGEKKLSCVHVYIGCKNLQSMGCLRLNRGNFCLVCETQSTSLLLLFFLVSLCPCQQGGGVDGLTGRRSWSA